MSLRVATIGAGVSAGRFLSDRGHRVTRLEQSPPANYPALVRGMVEQRWELSPDGFLATLDHRWRYARGVQPHAHATLPDRCYFAGEGCAAWLEGRAAALNIMLSHSNHSHHTLLMKDSTELTGKKAPAFQAPVIGGSYKEGATVSLADLKGQTVVLYFYPKDNTPGCTTQACALRDGWSRIQKKATVFGVSVDPVKRHANFIQQHSLPFPLISDEAKEIAQAYGVWVEKSMYGKKYMGTERSTFIIGPDGKVKAVLRKVPPAEHLDLVLEALG